MGNFERPLGVYSTQLLPNRRKWQLYSTIINFFHTPRYPIFQLLKRFSSPSTLVYKTSQSSPQILYRTALRKVSRIPPFRHKFDISAVKCFERKIRVMRRCFVRPEYVFVSCAVSLDKREQNSLQTLLRIYFFVDSKSGRREKGFLEMKLPDTPSASSRILRLT